MKRNKQLVLLLPIILAATVSAVISSSTAQSIGSFQVTNLIGSAGSGAPQIDAKMVNAWGNAFFPGNPFWINDQGTGVSELIDGAGTIVQSLPFVTVPGADGGQGQPTGIVANSTADFVLSTGGTASFIFDTEDGTISGWNQGTAAIIMLNNSGKASYTGLALAKNGTANQLYAANQGVTGHPGSIDVFSATFQPVTPSGGFNDPHLPANFTPYNVTTVNGNLFVAYSEGLQAVGQVDEFDPNGSLIMTFTSTTLAAPWGMVVAPANFGAFANDLLIGNLIDGTISAFDLSNGEFLGQLADSNSKTITIPGLWSLVDGDGALNAQAGAVYFTAGPNGYASGLFGLIEAVASATPTPTQTPSPTRTPLPTKTPKPTKTPRPTKTPKPTKAPRPTKTPKPTKAPRPTKTPKPAKTPPATETPAPTGTPGEPTATPTPTYTPYMPY